MKITREMGGRICSWKYCRYWSVSATDLMYHIYCNSQELRKLRLPMRKEDLRRSRSIHIILLCDKHFHFLLKRRKAIRSTYAFDLI